ncbi:MAG: hypothetical protein WKF90_13960 [Pyrinomonadaceae bacterium]
MATVTKTLNPLHFEDLEPHRFEDLARQLIYDFRNWTSLEAVGRLGSDEGIDIRAIEQLVDTASVEELEDVEDDVIQNTLAERVWIIQCKREKSITPKKIEKIIENDLSQQEQVPYSYMLIAACDFSKKTRDVFRSTVLSFGVQEFHIWGKAEIEDQLFQPKNDHLLFAYFGISLQVRRRSMKTALRSSLTLKRKLVKELGEMRIYHNKSVLIRDPRNEDYPYLAKEIDSIEKLSWRYWQFHSYHPKGFLVFVTRKCFAYFNQKGKQWDAIFDLNDAMPAHPELGGAKNLEINSRQNWSKYWEYWKNQIPNENQAWYLECRAVPFERVLAVDEIGDSWHEPPHLLVEYSENGIPFTDTTICFIQLDNRYKVVVHNYVYLYQFELLVIDNISLFAPVFN